MPDLILTVPAPTSPVVDTCETCARVRRYGVTRCRRCEWRIATPPPLVPGAEKARTTQVEPRRGVSSLGCGGVQSTLATARAKRARAERVNGTRSVVVALRD